MRVWNVEQAEHKRDAGRTTNVARAVRPVPLAASNVAETLFVQLPLASLFLWITNNMLLLNLTHAGFYWTYRASNYQSVHMTKYLQCGLHVLGKEFKKKKNYVFSWHNHYCRINIWIRLRQVSPCVIRPHYLKDGKPVNVMLKFLCVSFVEWIWNLVLLILLLCFVGWICVPVSSDNTSFIWRYSRLFFCNYLVLLLLVLFPDVINVEFFCCVHVFCSTICNIPILFICSRS